MIKNVNYLKKKKRIQDLKKNNGFIKTLYHLYKFDKLHSS